MSKPKQQHYIPAAWLALFTAEGRRDGRLWTFDPGRRKQWHSQPSNSAKIGDYMTIQSDGVDPYLMENWFSKIEGRGLPGLIQVIETGMLTRSPEAAVFFELLALQALRGPALRHTMVDFRQQVSEMMLRMAGSTPETFDRLTAAIRKRNPQAGRDDVPTFEEFQELLDQPDFMPRIANPAVLHAKGITPNISEISGILQQRTWAVRRAVDGAGELVTSDNPITITWMDPEDYKLWGPPGLIMSKTEVAVALSREVAIVGRLREVPTAGPLLASDVAAINRRTVMLAHRYVFGSRPTIPVMSWDGTLSWINCRPAAPDSAEQVSWEAKGWILATEPT